MIRSRAEQDQFIVNVARATNQLYTELEEVHDFTDLAAQKMTIAIMPAVIKALLDE